MFSLKQLLTYDDFVIQCHDNPDPDALGCAFAVQRYLTQKGKKAEIVYSGFDPIQKANLLLMQSAFGLQLRFLPRREDAAALGDKTLLITVDCQYGAGNVKQIPAAQVAVLDHHIVEGTPPELHDIRPFLGSCATLIWLLLKEEGFDFHENLDVATALYYGLYTDTGALGDILHPFDMDARDSLRYDAGLLKKLKNSNLTMEDLSIAGKTLTHCYLDAETRSAVFEAEPCDPNILGFASDLALQVDMIDACVVFCRVSGGVKLSLRSCVREIMANELAARLCEGVGSGGGHKEKAGGFLSGDALDRLGKTPVEFLTERMRDYFAYYDLFYSGALDFDPTVLPQFRKKRVPQGFVKSTDVFPAGTELIVRTLEGDAQIIAQPDIYIIVGVQQEVYPIRREKFEASYRPLDGDYAPDARFLPEERYAPTVRDRIEGTQIDLAPYIRPCVPTGEVQIYAKRLERRSKVFTTWNLDGYMFGDVGDYLAVRADDGNDAYVIEKAIFAHTYEPG